MQGYSSPEADEHPYWTLGGVHGVKQTGPLTSECKEPHMQSEISLHLGTTQSRQIVRSSRDGALGPRV